MLSTFAQIAAGKQAEKELAEQLAAVEASQGDLESSHATDLASIESTHATAVAELEAEASDVNTHLKPGLTAFVECARNHELLASHARARHRMSVEGTQPPSPARSARFPVAGDGRITHRSLPLFCKRQSGGLRRLLLEPSGKGEEVS